MADAIRKLAEKMTDDIFTNGQGSKAERLLLWNDSTTTDLGGWSERPCADRIETMLREAGVTVGKAQ